jgi:hypothetical protein
MTLHVFGWEYCFDWSSSVKNINGGRSDRYSMSMVCIVQAHAIHFNSKNIDGGQSEIQSWSV